MTETEADLRAFIASRLAGGFSDPVDIAEAAIEYVEEAELPVSTSLVQQLVPELLRARVRDQGGWPAVTDCDRLDAAFADLTRSGIVSRQNFTCCQTCGTAEIGAEIEGEAAAGLVPRGYAFYHQQDTERAVEGGGLYVSYGAMDGGDEPGVAVGREIVDTLMRHGLTCDWDGSIAKRVRVDLNWQRRIDASVAEV